MSTGGKRNLERQVQEKRKLEVFAARDEIMGNEELTDEQKQAALQILDGPNRKDRRAQQSTTVEQIVNRSGQKAVQAYKKKLRSRRLRKTHRRSGK